MFTVPLEKFSYNLKVYSSTVTVQFYCISFFSKAYLKKTGLNWDFHFNFDFRRILLAAIRLERHHKNQENRVRGWCSVSSVWSKRSRKTVKSFTTSLIPPMSTKLLLWNNCRLLYTCEGFQSSTLPTTQANRAQ